MLPDKLTVIATERLPHLGWAYEDLGRVQGMRFVSRSTDTEENYRVFLGWHPVLFSNRHSSSTISNLPCGFRSSCYCHLGYRHCPYTACPWFRGLWRI